MTWDKALMLAARQRATVVLRDGQRGVIVYAPHTTDPKPGKRPPRHGDPTKCGVRLDPDNPSFIAAVDPTEIIEIEPPKGTMITCPTCGAEVNNEALHTRWHEILLARQDLAHAHQENLIERVYALEGGDAANVEPWNTGRGGTIIHTNPPQWEPDES